MGRARSVTVTGRPRGCDRYRDGAADTQKPALSQGWRPGCKVSPGRALPGAAGKNPARLSQLLAAIGALGVPWLVDTWLHSVFTRGSV